MSARDDAIRFIEEALDTHRQWHREVRSEADPQGPVGNADWHRTWIERYELVLAVLRRGALPRRSQGAA